MGKNRLFQDARRFVEDAKKISTQGGHDKERAIMVAQNALSSAYANTTFAEQKQLREFQSELDQLTE